MKKEVIKEEVLEEPVKEVIVKGTKVVPSRGDGAFVWPTNGGIYPAARDIAGAECIKVSISQGRATTLSRQLIMVT